MVISLRQNQLAHQARLSVSCGLSKKWRTEEKGMERKGTRGQLIISRMQMSTTSKLWPMPGKRASIVFMWR